MNFFPGSRREKIHITSLRKEEKLGKGAGPRGEKGEPHLFCLLRKNRGPPLYHLTGGGEKKGGGESVPSMQKEGKKKKKFFLGGKKRKGPELQRKGKKKKRRGEYTLLWGERRGGSGFFFALEERLSEISYGSHEKEKGEEVLFFHFVEKGGKKGRAVSTASGRGRPRVGCKEKIQKEKAQKVPLEGKEILLSTQEAGAGPSEEGGENPHADAFSCEEPKWGAFCLLDPHPGGGG